MEENLFSFEAAQGDAELIQYFKVTLKSKFGEFEAGRFFDLAILDTEKATMSFFDGEVLKGRFSVQLNIITDLLNDA